MANHPLGIKLPPMTECLALQTRTGEYRCQLCGLVWERDEARPETCRFDQEQDARK